ncbi:MAG: hypothetical protein SFU56_06665 [Capsulimonadales bacterium]|nr:hypothetical protein [Capsulimonadales bacterium]
MHVSRSFLCSLSLLSLLSLLALTSGCGNDKVSAQEEEKMRKQMTQKFDINQVPPEHRDRVRGFMNMGSQKPPTAAPSASPSAKPK